MRFPELLSLGSLINISAKINHKGVLTVFGTSEAPWVQREIFHIIWPLYEHFNPLVYLYWVSERSGARADEIDRQIQKLLEAKGLREKYFHIVHLCTYPLDFNDHSSFLCYRGFHKNPFRLINTTSNGKQSCELQQIVFPPKFPSPKKTKIARWISNHVVVE